MLRGIQKFILLSLVLHLLFSGGLFISGQLAKDSKNISSVEIEFQSTKETNQDPIKPKMQIVDQSDKAINQEIDANAKYFSKNNQVVKKQTVAKNRGEFQNAPQQTQGPAQANSTSQNSPPSENLKSFLPQFDASKAYEKEASRVAKAEAELLKLKQEREPQNHSSRENESESAGGLMSQTLDYIRDLDPGLETMLTTREFVYFSYYSRIRKQLNQYWTPKIQDTVRRIYAQGRNLASDQDKITRCLVTLDKSGKVLRVQIIGESGVRDLDEAAVDAFRAAAPFPNPPAGMVEADGTIRLRWDFVLEA